jgi:membrane protein implicated in regulation of membrane protease activity
MAAWLVWLVAGLILIAAEVATGGLWLLMIGLGALGGALAAAAGATAVPATIVFAIVSIALIGGIRPVLRRKFLGAHRAISTNTQALIGAKATVIMPVDSEKGRVKIGGEIWSARAHHAGTEAFPQGAPVIVVDISGATAIVAPEP